jgi:hypothetical protein
VYKGFVEQYIFVKLIKRFAVVIETDDLTKPAILLITGPVQST